MEHYYINARPETVVSIVKRGTLPDHLPDYCKQDTLFCSKTIQPPYSLHQTFILRIKGTPKAFTAKQIDPNAIQTIFVASEQAHKLITNLFKGACPKPVEIFRELFPSKKRTSTQATQPKRSKFILQPSFWTLRSMDAHLLFLQSAFCQAKRTILLTTYNINHETLLKADLYQLIPQAVQRGVTIYLYFSDEFELEEDVEDFFEEWNVQYNDSYTHSKILAIDRELVAIGSCNWLAMINQRYGESENASIVCQGYTARSLIQDIWQHLKYYRHLQFDNRYQIKKFERRRYNLCAIVYPFKNRSKLTYLPTLESHRGYFIQLFQKARNCLIICAPFISPQFLEDIDEDILLETTKRGVHIYFVCQEKTFPEELKEALLSLPRMHLVMTNNVHSKTIIRDDIEIAEGSFNWMSATRDPSSPFHHHEATLVAQGPDARALIHAFYQTRVGRAILAACKKTH